MCKFIISSVLVLLSLSMIILSSVKYGTSGKAYCDTLYNGLIKNIETGYSPGTNNTGFLIIEFDIYIRKSQNDVRFVKTYKMITSVEEANRYQINERFKFSQTVNLYQNCLNLNPQRYYFENFTYFQGTWWQPFLAYSIVALIASASLLAFFVIERKYDRPVFQKYTSEEIFPNESRRFDSPNVKIYSTKNLDTL